MSAPSPTKRTLGQFFTEGNPFVFSAFHSWVSQIPGIEKTVFVEPFAGANHIVRLVREAGYDNAWACFDISPQEGLKEGLKVQKRDTLEQFPRGYNVAITNPPYLARNSAKRRGLNYPQSDYNDLYKHALDISLQHCGYVAAIIPESFVVAGQFHDRLAATVSLTSKMFDDTDCPVCLALFVPADQKPQSNDFELWDEEQYLGQYQTFAGVMAPVAHKTPWKFNDPQGRLGLRGVDNNDRASICFVRGDTIDSTDIKHSSRAISRIGGVPDDIDLDALIIEANKSLAHYRKQTHDTLMTPFKGLRRDGKYRRRLDFAAARNLLDHCAAALRSAQT